MQLKLWPYAYLSNPSPVYHQLQNTRTGEYAYSYAGGPSAKEEIKEDGVTRGSYSYVDANGILQSVFYVADENGFRVAATDLPSDNNLNLEAAHILVARDTKAAETTKSSRRKRSLEEPSQSSNQSEQKKKTEPADSVLPEILSPIATSRQSQVQIHKSLHSEPLRPLVSINAQPFYQPLLLPGVVSVVTSSQSPVQVYKRVNLSKNLPHGLVNVLASPLQNIESPSGITPVYQQDRIELHKQLGIEGAKTKDAVKIDSEPLTIIKPSLTVPIAPAVAVKEVLPVAPAVIAKEALPVVPAAQLGTVSTSITSHGISQIHPSPILKEVVAIPDAITKEAVAVADKKEFAPLLQPIFVKQAVPVVPQAEEAKLAEDTVTTGVSSHGVTITQLRPDIDIPIWLI